MVTSICLFSMVIELRLSCLFITVDFVLDVEISMFSIRRYFCKEFSDLVASSVLLAIIHRSSAYSRCLIVQGSLF